MFFGDDLYFDITYLRAFTDVPSAIQRYIIARASVRAATQLVSNADLVKLLQLEEEKLKLLHWSTTVSKEIIHSLDFHMKVITDLINLTKHLLDNGKRYTNYSKFNSGYITTT